MAEILLSLTIIGVVAAITLPSLTGNINERTWATQKKALYARMSQAFPLLDSINTYDDAESFIAGALNTVTKINNVCSQENLEDCGINTAMIAALNGSAMSSFQGTWSELGISVSAADANSDGDTSVEQSIADANWDEQSAAFETGNGESVLLYYNPRCVGSLAEAPWGGSSGYYVHNKVCANFVYDLNGNKGPNTVGKDIGFMTAMYPSDVKVAAPYPMVNPPTGTYQYNATDPSQSGAKICSTLDSEYRLPNTEEAISLFVNKELLQSSSNKLNGIYWTSSRIYNKTTSSVPPMWVFTGQGVLDDHGQSESWKVWCVKR